MKCFARLVLAVFVAGCSSSTEAKNPGDLDGTWSEVTEGLAPSSTSDDALAGYANDNPASVWELTLSNGAGTLTLTDNSTPAAPCVVSRSVSIVANDDGSGSTTEGDPGTLVRSSADDCAGDVGFNFFGKGTSTLLRVSRTGIHLVLMSSRATSDRFTFIVYAKK